MSLPRFEKNFRERTQEAWAAFSQIEAELRQIIDTDETHQRGEELVEKCGNALKTALRDTSFELGFNGEKHELILSPEGLRSRLFPLVYFQKQAPESVLEHWNIWVGRQPCEGFELRAGEIEVRAEDVQMWAEETEDHQVSLVLYCEKLTPILKEDTDKVWWALSMLVDQTIGEVSAIAFVAGFDVYAQPKDEPAKLLSELPELLQSMGLSLWRDGSDYLENSYLAYELEPVEDPEADWRLDVYTGSCRLPVLINDYLTARSDMVDEYHKDGIAAGFLLYPLSGFTGEERVKAILDFRDNLRDAILRDAGEEAVTFLGGATGLYCGYLDFIAWDLPAVLTAAQAFFEGSDLPYAHFHAFRRDVGGVPLLDEKEPEPDIHEETGSLLSTEDITEPTPPQESALKGNKRMSWRTWLGGSLFGISALIIFVLWRLSVRFPISGMTGNGVHLTGFSGFLGFHGILHESYVIVAIGIIGLILLITDFIRIKKNNR